MTRTRVIVLIAIFAMWPAGAFAQSDFIDWLDSFSGPGPFHGATLSMRALCTRENGGTYKIGTCLSDTDDSIKTVLNVEGGFATSGNNPRFSDTPTDTLPVHLTRVDATYMYRVSPMLDIGVGAGVTVFSGDGFANQVHPILTPFAVTFVPFGIKRSSPLATKWGRVLRITYSERFVMQDIRAVDFHSLSTYLKSGEFNRGFGVGVDFWSFFVH